MKNKLVFLIKYVGDNKMKNLFLVTLILCLINEINAQEIKVNKTKQNFGFVNEGDTVHLNYKIKNIGDKSLIISDYEVECGCTVVERMQIALEPGETHNIKVSFDTHQKFDRQDRTIKIISNAVNSPLTLRFKGVILKPKKKD